MNRATSHVANDKLLLSGLLFTLILLSWFTGIRSQIVEWIGQSTEEAIDARPNILLIVADDLGYNDSTLINSGGIPTPNLNALAERGVTFTRHYADATCTPSRVGLLSGRYPERSGFRPVGIEIPTEFPTVAEQLSAAGYATYLTGKWHAGEERALSQPHNKGFDSWFGFLNQWELSGEVTEKNKGKGKRPTYRDPMLRTNGGMLTPHPGHLTDILAKHTIQKIRALQSDEKPWFLYHAFLAPHHPIQPAPRYKARFPDTPEGEYRALVTQMDDAVGDILKAVESTNTLVIFLSDNGGTNKQFNNNFPFHGKKGDVFEGAYRTPLVLSWPEESPSGTLVHDVVMNVDIYPTILAAAGVPIPLGLDGQNLWPTVTAGAPHAPRERGWEVYSENVGTMNYSFLSESGNWRIASGQGMEPGLYDLLNEPGGKTDVASLHPDITADLGRSFWKDHWKKSLLPVTEQRSEASGKVLYQGLDAMRTPFRYGLTIGLELGPLPASVGREDGDEAIVLAGQENTWKLLYSPGQGLEWHIGDQVLRDASFNPRVCNPVVLTNYFQPLAQLAVREPQSQIKLYSSGTLRDYNFHFDYSTVASNRLEAPTFVNYGGAAQFANMTASAFSDPYQPRVNEQFVDFYDQLFKARKLSIVDVQLMTAQLCNNPLEAPSQPR